MIETNKDNVKVTKFDSPIESVSWSPDGNTYVTTNGNKLIFWDSETDEIIAQKSNSDASIISVKFSKIGSSIVTVHNDNSFIVEDLDPDSTFKLVQQGIFELPILDAVFYENPYTLLVPLDGQNIYKFLCLMVTAQLLPSGNER